MGFILAANFIVCLVVLVFGAWITTAMFKDEALEFEIEAKLGALTFGVLVPVVAILLPLFQMFGSHGN